MNNLANPIVALDGAIFVSIVAGAAPVAGKEFGDQKDFQPATAPPRWEEGSARMR